jgi:hypothetical protein
MVRSWLDVTCHNAHFSRLAWIYKIFLTMIVALCRRWVNGYFAQLIMSLIDSRPSLMLFEKGSGVRTA